METHSCSNGCQEQGNNAFGAAFHGDHLIGHRHFIGDGKMHNRRRHHKINHRRHKQIKEVPEMNDTFLPDHQGSDISKRTKGTTGISSDYDIDAGQSYKTSIGAAHSQYYRTH